MRRFPRLATFVVLLAATAPAWAAAIVDKVQVEGLDDELMIENINAALSLNDSLGNRLGESRLEYLLGEAVAETREALEPFGYYSPTVTIEAPRNEAAEDERLTVVVRVQLGEPVRVRKRDLSIDGEGGEDRYLKEDLAAFAPAVGDVFDHTTYEASKLAIVRRLADRGYFDADFTHRRVEVTRADHAADIALGWVSGIRYDMGATTFHQDKFDQGLLDKLVYWEEGSYFHQGKLDRLRESLVGLDYFSSIDIQANPDKAEEGRVPIDVNLELAKRDIYTAGISYGTESGPVSAWDWTVAMSTRAGTSCPRTWTTRRSARRCSRSTAFRRSSGWTAGSRSACRPATNRPTTSTCATWNSPEAAVARSAKTGPRSPRSMRCVSAGAMWRTIRSPACPTLRCSTPPSPIRRCVRTTPIRPSVRIAPTSWRAPSCCVAAWTVRDRMPTSCSSTCARWSQRYRTNSTLIVRGEYGHTFTSSLVAMPPSLRFFAGGDRSIRGYAWREVGPRRGDYSLGAKNVLTSSVEYEFYPKGGPYGGAVFVDTGSAFDGTRPDLSTGIGVGLRWRSPVGPVRLDLAHGLNDPDSSFQIYLNIGTDL